MTTRRQGILVLAALAAMVAAAILLGLPEPVRADVTGIWADCGRGRIPNRISFPGQLPASATMPREGSNYRVNIYPDGGGDGRIRGHWYTVAGSADTSDYVDVQGQYQEGNGVINGEFSTVEDRYSEFIDGEGPETFTIRFVNAAPGGENAECKVDIYDNDGEGAHNARVTSSPADGETYRLGETIEITMDFTTFVETRGDVLVGLRVGGDDGWRGARFLRGVEDDPLGRPRYKSLVFGYEVQPGDLDDDGISMDGGYVDDGVTHGYGGSGRIVKRGTDSQVNSWFRGIGDQSGHQVDGSVHATATQIVSTPASGDTYGVGETIEIALTYNNPVEVEGSKIIGLRMGTGSWWRGAAYNRGSGTGTLVFSYQVQSADFDDNGISLDGGFRAGGETHGYGGNGTIKAAGTEVEVHYYYPGLSHDPDHKVDAVLRVTDVSITSNPGDDLTYGVGDFIEVTVTFSADVTKTGIPQLALTFDSGTVNAPYISHWSNQLLFGYGVQVGDTDADGIAIAANSLDLNGGSIRDLSENDAVLSHDAVPADANHMVSAPGGL